MKEGKDGFYCKDGLMSYASRYNILICMGGRFIGKSTEWQRAVLKNFIKKGWKFGVVKNTEKALAEFAPDYWSKDWMEKWFPNFELKYKSKTYYLRRKRDGQKDNEDWVECGYAFYLSRTSKKSTTKGQDIKWLIFEEFTNQEGVYLGNSQDREKEPALLMSLYQTLARGEKGASSRDMKLIMLSNLYSIDNPYFTAWGILPMITSSKNGIYQRFYTYDKGNLHYVIEFPQLRPNKAIMAATENDEGIKFQDYRHELKLVKNPNNKEIILQLTLDNNRLLSIARFNESLICFAAKKRVEKALCFSCSRFKGKGMIGMNLLKREPIYDVIKRAFEDNGMYYDKLESFIYLTNILAY